MLEKENLVDFSKKESTKLIEVIASHFCCFQLTLNAICIEIQATILQIQLRL